MSVPPGPRSHRPRPRSISPALPAVHAEGYLGIIVAASPSAGIPARIMFRNPARTALPPRWRTFGKLFDNRAAVLTRVTGGTQTQREKKQKSTLRMVSLATPMKQLMMMKDDRFCWFWSVFSNDVKWLDHEALRLLHYNMQRFGFETLQLVRLIP